MKLENFYKLRYLGPDGPVTDGMYYDAPGRDVDSPGFREEQGIEAIGPISAVPQEDWDERDICAVADAFFDDQCKSGPFYGLFGLRDRMEAEGIPADVRQKVLWIWLTAIEEQFGY